MLVVFLAKEWGEICTGGAGLETRAKEKTSYSSTMSYKSGGTLGRKREPRSALLYSLKSRKVCFSPLGIP